MSLVVLARKTRTKQRLKLVTCGNGRNRGRRSGGLVLNMTSRGGGIGLSGRAGTCCTANGIVKKSARDACSQCWYYGRSQPAPQMSYRNYINRKASGACCDPKCSKSKHGLRPSYINPNKNPNTWKKNPNISASKITEHKKMSAIRCANALVKRNPVTLGNVVISNRITAKPACSWYNPETCKYETVKKCNPLQNECRGGKRCALPVNGRVSYTRINNNWCNTTKTLTVNESSGDQIAKRKQVAFKCPCPKNQTDTDCNDFENNKRSSNRYCYPRPMATGNNRGLLDEKTKARIACLRTGCTVHPEESEQKQAAPDKYGLEKDDAEYIYEKFLKVYLTKGIHHLPSTSIFLKYYKIIENKIKENSKYDFRLNFYKDALTILLRNRDLFFDKLLLNNEKSTLINYTESAKHQIYELTKKLSYYTKDFKGTFLEGRLGIKINHPKPMIYAQAILDINRAWYIYLFQTTEIDPNKYMSAECYIEHLHHVENKDPYCTLIKLLDEKYKTVDTLIVEINDKIVEENYNHSQ